MPETTGSIAGCHCVNLEVDLAQAGDEVAGAIAHGRM